MSSQSGRGEAAGSFFSPLFFFLRRDTLDVSHYGSLARTLEGMKKENQLDGKISYKLKKIKKTVLAGFGCMSPRFVCDSRI